MSRYEEPQKAIDDGGEALASAHRFSWYDRANDALQPVELRSPSAGQGWLYLGREMNGPMLHAAIAALTIVMLGLLFVLLRAARLRKSKKTLGEPILIGEAERIDALPFPVARAKLSLLDQAHTFYRSGDFSRAMLYLYSHQLVQLDRHQFIHLAKGKTNRQYLREIGPAARLGQLIDQSLVAFEEVFFGHHAIDRPRFEACWSRLGEFDTLLMRRAAEGRI